LSHCISASLTICTRISCFVTLTHALLLLPHLRPHALLRGWNSPLPRWHCFHRGLFHKPFTKTSLSSRLWIFIRFQISTYTTAFVPQLVELTQVSFWRLLRNRVHILQEHMLYRIEIEALSRVVSLHGYGGFLLHCGHLVRGDESGRLRRLT